MSKIGAIFGIPTAVGVVIWIVKYMTDPSPSNLSQAGPLIAQAATPWWIPVLQFIANVFPGIVGAILIIGLLYFFVAKNNG